MLAAPDDATLIARYDARVPRYTSYPTAPHFSAAVDGQVYADWLRALPAGAKISLYLHVPFCDRLCLYCGCNTAVVRHDGPKRAYAKLLLREIELVAAQIGRSAPVAQIHWGGGTPTSLPADCLLAIMAHIRTHFAVAPEAEIAIEIDPTAVSAAGLDALAQMGVNRASLGVQDFDPRVQQAIGRRQSFAETLDCATALRRRGINALNLDLIYGLPHQSEDSVRRTARQALQFGAGRIAVFGYAHVPWMKKHQALIDESALPNAVARFAQNQAMRQVLQAEGGYIPIGLDHFALPDDAMARAAAAKRLQRNFQGYSTDAAPVLLGLGASAIGTLPQGYVQNASAVPGYKAAIEAGQLAAMRGIALTPDDRLRRQVIETIMCDLTVELPPALLPAPDALADFAADGLLRRAGNRITVTERGRPFIRNIAALFDAYLPQAGAALRHASSV